MQRIPATIEEQLILKAIKEECPWENLPKRLQATVNSKEDWHRRFVFLFFFLVLSKSCLWWSLLLSSNFVVGSYY